MAVSVSNVDLMERVCHLTNKILGEILSVTSVTRHGKKRYTINMDGIDQNQDMAFSRMALKQRPRVVVSRDLLDWITMEGKIPDFFTNFITTSSELSRPSNMYIRSDCYHTQITEYLLTKIYM